MLSNLACPKVRHPPPHTHTHTLGAPWIEPSTVSTPLHLTKNHNSAPVCLFTAGSGGGGQAGKSRGSNTNLNFERHVPKFLQPYAHLLGQKRQDEDEPQVVAAQRAMHDQEDDDEEDKAAEQVSRGLEGEGGAARRVDGNGGVFALQ